MALVTVATVGVGHAQEQKNPGEKVFARVCETCHGPKANGDGQGPALVPYNKDLGELTTIVRQGIGLMPGIPRDQISDAEIEQVHVYLKNLTSSRAPERPALHVSDTRSAALSGPRRSR